MFKAFDVEARNQGELPYGHLLERLLPNLTLLAEELLVGPKPLRSSEAIQTPSEG